MTHVYKVAAPDGPIWFSCKKQATRRAKKEARASKTTITVSMCFLRVLGARTLAVAMLNGKWLSREVVIYTTKPRKKRVMTWHKWREVVEDRAEPA